MMAMITIRPATLADAQILLDWRNNDISRSASLSRDEILFEEHLAWLAGVLEDADRTLYVALDDGDPAGTSRFDIEGGGAEVSINLNPAYRGRGLSLPVLRASIEQFFVDRRRRMPLTAQIRSSNAASIAIFTRVGFAHQHSHDGVGHYLLASAPSLSAIC